VSDPLSRPVRVLHVITGLGLGGAERFLERMVVASDPARVRHQVLSLKPVGDVGRALSDRGVPVYSLELGRDVEASAFALPALVHLARTLAPDVVQGWLHHGDLAATVAARAAHAALAWGLHQSAFDPAHALTTVGAARIAAALSRLPDAIVCCGESARRGHVALGYDDGRMLVIENGFDTGAIRAARAARGRSRAAFGLEGKLAVGLVGRDDPVKDVPTFLDAMAAVKRDLNDLAVVMVGPGHTLDNPRLARALADRGLHDITRALGPRSDALEIMAGLDVLVLSSKAEGLPLVVGEALLVGVPVVATDVGDSGRVLGPGGTLVPAGDPEAIARAALELAAAGPAVRRRIAEAGARHVEETLALHHSVERYTRVYEDLHVRHRRIP